MAIVDVAMQAVHLLFAGAWTGSVVFFAYAVLPPAADGDLPPGPLEAAVGKLTTVSRASALLLLVTGAHLAATGYTAAGLLQTARGQAVLVMVGLWLALAALVEVGAARMREGLAEEKVRAPARRGAPFLKAGAVVAVLVLVDAGVLAGLP